jgi:hypothetical protein
MYITWAIDLFPKNKNTERIFMDEGKTLTYIEGEEEDAVSN